MPLSGCYFKYADSVGAGVVNASWYYTHNWKFTSGVPPHKDYFCMK